MKARIDILLNLSGYLGRAEGGPAWDVWNSPYPGIVGPPQRPATKLSPELLLWEDREGRGKEAVQAVTTH